MRKLYLFIYYTIVQRLPRTSFPLGSFFNRIRIFVVSKLIVIGKGCKFQNGIYFGNGENIEIGNNCYINENVKLDNVKIGNSVMVARNATFLGKMHHHARTDIPMIDQGFYESKQTIVKDDVWIGTNAVIMPDLIIEEGCIIAAGAVLTKNTVPYGIYGGVPAKLIKVRNSEESKEK